MRSGLFKQVERHINDHVFLATNPIQLSAPPPQNCCGTHCNKHSIPPYEALISSAFKSALTSRATARLMNFTHKALLIYRSSPHSLAHLVFSQRYCTKPTVP